MPEANADFTIENRGVRQSSLVQLLVDEGAEDIIDTFRSPDRRIEARGLVEMYKPASAGEK